MAIPEYDGCPWPIDAACLDDTWNGLSPEVQLRATMLASNTLRRLTGYRVGGCPITVRPCKATACGDRYLPAYGSYSAFNPHISTGGFWVNSCGCKTDCACETLCKIDLPGPVMDVTEVKLNGEVVPEEDYRVSGNELIWVGEDDCPWPACQDMKALDGDGTFLITYLNSYPVDGIGAYAAGILAMEYAKACSGGKCRLPAAVTAVTRAGVSYEIASGVFPDGFTGIREVDAYLSLWNPGSLRQQAQVWSPDMAKTRVQ